MKEFKSALSALVAAVVIFVLLGQTGRPGQLGAGIDQDRWAHLGAMNDMKVVQGELNRVAGAGEKTHGGSWGDKELSNLLTRFDKLSKAASQLRANGHLLFPTSPWINPSIACCQSSCFPCAQLKANEESLVADTQARACNKLEK